jgi:hypothetical protein
MSCAIALSASTRFYAIFSMKPSPTTPWWRITAGGLYVKSVDDIPVKSTRIRGVKSAADGDICSAVKTHVDSDLAQALEIGNSPGGDVGGNLEANHCSSPLRG